MYEQKKIPESQCAVANFLLSWITTPERTGKLFQNIRTAALVHTDMAEHTQSTHTKQLSVIQPSLFRYTERAVTQSNLAPL